MTSTLRSASWRAMMSFSRLPSRVPAACSPSLNVVSKTATFSEAVFGDMADCTFTHSGRVKNSSNFFRRDGKFSRDARHLAVFTFPDFGDDDAGKFLGHLLKGFVLDATV